MNLGMTVFSHFSGASFWKVAFRTGVFLVCFLFFSAVLPVPCPAQPPQQDLIAAPGTKISSDTSDLPPTSGRRVFTKTIVVHERPKAETQDQPPPLPDPASAHSEDASALVETEYHDSQSPMPGSTPKAVRALPNLYPYQPPGWDDKIVVSAVPNTHTNDIIYAGEKSYIDYAYANSDADITQSFRSAIYINGSLFKRGVNSEGIPAGYYGYGSDRTYTFLQAGTYLITFICDVDEEIVESDENDNGYSVEKNITVAGLGGNLAPYQPSGWDDALTVSASAGTHVENEINAGDTGYLDFACINNGKGDIIDNFSVGLYVNDELVLESPYTGGLQQGYYADFNDIPYTFTQAGSVNLKFVCDSGSTVAESDENDNTYQKTKTITGGDGPNLTPYKPDGWENSINVSNVPETNTDTLVYAAETVYVDYAYINNGNQDIKKRFYSEIYIDDKLLRRGFVDGLNAGLYGYATDVEHVFAEPGSYEIKLICDTDMDVAEYNESDNIYTRFRDALAPGASGPNLTPFKPDGWEERIVVSGEPGSHEESRVTAGVPAYIDYSYINNGDTDIRNTHYTYVLINNILIRRETIGGLSRNDYASISDIPYIFPKSGTYTLDIICDAENNVAEYNESDNTYSRSKTVVDQGAVGPNIAPYNPDGWDDVIVVSTEPETHLQDQIFADEPAYLDYAFINNGNEDIFNRFYFSFYINGERIRRQAKEGLLKNFFSYASDVEYVFPRPGTYTLMLILDSDNDVAEIDETDNAYSKSITVYGSEDPVINIAPLALNFRLNQEKSSTSRISARSSAPPTLHFKRGDLTPSLQKTARTLHISDTKHVILVFPVLPDSAMRRDLQEHSVHLLDYIPDNGLRASLGKAGADYLKSAFPEVQMITLPPEYKVSNDLFPGPAPARTIEPDGRMLLQVSMFSDVGRDEAVADFASLTGCSVLEYGPDTTYIVLLPPESLASLAALDGVHWIEPAPPARVSNNTSLAVNIKVNEMRAEFQTFGNSVTVGLWDEGTVDEHSDFGSRLRIIDSKNPKDHATHTAGTIFGSGLGNGKARGMAPSASLWSYDWTNDVLEMRSGPINGINISNNSYGAIVGWHRGSDQEEWIFHGDSLFGDYSSTTQQWDKTVYDTGLIVFKSAGNDRNDGPDTCPGGAQCDGPYDTITHISTAKNIITLGAVNSADQMTPYSSWGPTDDGRIKPDLIADGDTVLSTQTGNTYGTISGTSSSTAGACGAGALLYEQYVNIYGFSPTPDVLKAVMIHGADDLGPNGPDYMYGYGRINTTQSGLLIARGAPRIGSISENGGMQTYSVSVSPGTASLKTTLVWTDPPASPSAASALVNDLDLRLLDPSGGTHSPWILDPAHPEYSATKGVNSLDNVEQSVILNPTPGTWTVQIEGSSLPQGPQSFAVVLEGAATMDQSFTIRNQGEGILTINDIQSENGSEWLSWSPQPPFSIDPDKTETVNVTVNPEVWNGSDLSDRLFIYSNDPEAGVYPGGVRVLLTDADPSDPALYTGWWYTPSEAGSGISLQVIDDILFLAWYAYDEEGNSKWYVSWAEKDAENCWRGDLREYRGWELGTPWAAPSYETVGDVALVFTDAENALLSWRLDSNGGGEKHLEKYMDSIASGPTDTRNITGWWIDPNYSGMGFFLEAQADTMYLGWFHYREDTTPRWWVLGGWMDPGGFPDGTTDYTQSLHEFSNGQTLGGTWKAADETESPGEAVLYFQGNNDDLSISLYQNGTVYNLERYSFDGVPQ